MHTNVRPLDVLDTEIAAAAEALQAAQGERDAFFSHLLRLFSLGAGRRGGRRGQVAAVAAARAQLDALLAERAAAIEESAIRALVPALASRAEPPPPGEPLAPLEAALDLLGQVIAALQEAELHLRIVEPYGASGVAVTSGHGLFQGGVRPSLAQGYGAVRRASALADALAAHDPACLLPVPRAPPTSVLPLTSTIADAHGVGRNVREVLDAASALAERLTARRSEAVERRRGRVAWERSH